jgi:anti-sigma factor RsiW
VKQHLGAEQIKQHVRRELSPAALLALDDHLAHCPACRDAVAAALRTDATGLYAELAAEATAGAHLTFDQTAAYVDGQLGGEQRRAIEDHLGSCAACAPLAEDLRAFRNEIAPELDRELRPANSPQPGLAAPPRPGRRDRIPFFNLPTWASALALALLAVVGWLMWRTTRGIEPPPIATASPTPAPAPTPAMDPVPVLAQLNDGGALLSLDAAGRLRGAENWPAEYQQLVQDALRNPRIEKSPQLANLSRPGSSLMSEDKNGRSFSLLEPAGNVLLRDRPAFRWSRLEGATRYVVEIYDAQFNPVASSPPLNGLRWTAPPLDRGRTYLWQVKATTESQEVVAPAPNAPQARFRILDAANANEIARARRAYESSHLLLGLLYARAGLLAEAETELRALQRANPDSETARRLAASLHNNVSGKRIKAKE